MASNTSKTQKSSFSRLVLKSLTSTCRGAVLILQKKLLESCCSAQKYITNVIVLIAYKCPYKKKSRRLEEKACNITELPIRPNCSVKFGIILVYIIWLIILTSDLRLNLIYSARLKHLSLSCAIYELCTFLEHSKIALHYIVPETAAINHRRQLLGC